MNAKKKTKESKKPEKDFVEVKREKKEDFEAIKTKRIVQKGTRTDYCGK